MRGAAVLSKYKLSAVSELKLLNSALQACPWGCNEGILEKVLDAHISFNVRQQLYEAGKVRLLLDKLEEAIGWLRAAQATRPSASYLLAEAYLKKGEYEPAAHILYVLYRGELNRQNERRR